MQLFFLLMHTFTFQDWVIVIYANSPWYLGVCWILAVSPSLYRSLDHLDMQGFSKDRSPDKLTDCEDGFGFLVWQFGVFLKSLVYKEVLFKLHCFPVKTGFPGGGRYTRKYCPAQVPSHWKCQWNPLLCKFFKLIFASFWPIWWKCLFYLIYFSGWICGFLLLKTFFSGWDSQKVISQF